MSPAPGAAQTEASDITKWLMPSPLGDSLRSDGNVTESYSLVEGKQMYKDTPVPAASAAVLEHLNQGSCILATGSAVCTVVLHCW